METMTIHVCPNGCDSTFSTTAHVTQDWEVDAFGNFVNNLGGEQTIHGPDNDNIWTCQECGSEAECVECYVKHDMVPGIDLLFPKARGDTVYWMPQGTTQLCKAIVQHDGLFDNYVEVNGTRVVLSKSTVD